MIESNQLKSLARRHDEISQHLRTLMWTLLMFSVFSVIVLSTPDSEILLNNLRVSLPLFNASVEFQHFFVAGPLLLILLYLYLHALIRHKKSLELQIGSDFSALQKWPAIFNMDLTTARIATTIIFYLLTPLILCLFMLRARSVGQEIAVIAAGLMLVIAAVTAVAGLEAANRKSIGTGAGVTLIGIMALVVATRIDVQEREFRWDLSGVQAAGSNLHGRNLSRYNLSGAVLDGADLRKADLSNSLMIRASLERATLKDAILNRSTMNYAFLRRADMEGIRALGATWEGVRANHSVLRQSDFGIAANLAGGKFHGSTFEGTTLDRANMRGAGLRSDFSWARLEGANLIAADAVGAKMVRTKLNPLLIDADGIRVTDESRAVQRIRSDLTRISLELAVLINANLRDSILRQAILRQTLLHGTDLTGADLTGADLGGAQLNNYDLDNYNWGTRRYGGDLRLRFSEVQDGGDTGPAKLVGANLTDARLAGANISGVDLSAVNGLNRSQLMEANGDDSTRLPPSISPEEASNLYEVWSSRSHTQARR